MNDNWHDKVEWHYKSAFENYCRTHGVEEESLSEEESDLIADFAGTHIGLFWMWIVLHHFEGEIHRDPEDQNAIRLLESGKITFTSMKNGWNTTGMACSISCHAPGNFTVK